MIRNLILASASPRRRELLKAAGIEFDVEAAEVDETARPGESAETLVARLAELKARAVAVRNPQKIVLGADTVVTVDGRIFGKPASYDEAAAMLTTFSGRAHWVLTGVCLVFEDGSCRTWVCRSEVHFKNLTPEMVRGYHAVVNPLDKAGGYAVQEHGDMIVDHVDGLESNVVGLPVEEVIMHLEKK